MRSRGRPGRGAPCERRRATAPARPDRSRLPAPSTASPSPRPSPARAGPTGRELSSADGEPCSHARDRRGTMCHSASSAPGDMPMTPDPYFDLTGKVALVTGGSRGLGRQMVLAFAERGAEVIVASRKLENCEKVAAEARELGHRALPCAVHAAKWDSIDRLIAAAYAEFGRVDLLVNNAGMSPPMPSHEVTEELFDSVVG